MLDGSNRAGPVSATAEALTAASTAATVAAALADGSLVAGTASEVDKKGFNGRWSVTKRDTTGVGVGLDGSNRGGTVSVATAASTAASVVAAESTVASTNGSTESVGNG